MPAAIFFMELGEGGRVFSCCPAWGKNEIGNIRDHTIAEIWNGPEIQFIRRKILDGKWADVCRPTCPFISNYRVTGETIKLDGLQDEQLTPILESEIRAGKIFLQSFPTVFNFSNSGLCNLDCIMCGNKYMKEDSVLLQKTLDAVWPYLQDAKRITLSGGGNPFVRPDTRKILLEFDRKMNPGLKINLLTNGLLLPIYWDRIKHHKFGYINISMDAATKGTYEKIRRRGKWENIMNTLSVVKENKERFDDVIINMTVMKENYKEIPLFVQLGQNFGFNVLFHMVRTAGDLNPSSNFFESGDKETLMDFIKIINDIDAEKFSIHIDWKNLVPYISKR